MTILEAAPGSFRQFLSTLGRWQVAGLALVAVLATVLMVGVSPGTSFMDEYDNYLGAQVILKGGALFTDYFTQHMPLTYYLALPFVAVFGTNLVLIRVAFALFLAIWLLTFSRHLLRAFGARYAIVFVALVAISFGPAWANMFMAETWIAWAVAHAVILFWTRSRNGVNPVGALITLAVLGCIPILSALAYAPLSFAIYALLAWWAVEYRRSARRRDWVGIGAALVAPYLVIVGILASTGSLGDFYFQAFQFNTLYYAKINDSAPSGAIDGIILIVQVFFTGLYHALTDRALPNQPVALLFAAVTLVSLAWLVLRKQFTIAGVLAVFIFFAASRGVWHETQAGFAAILPGNPNSRHSTSLLLLGFLAVLAMSKDMVSANAKSMVSAGTLKVGKAIAILTVIAATVAVVVPSAASSARQLRDVIAGRNTVAVAHGPGTAPDIINTVNGPDDTYWLAPAEWDLQLYVTSRNASNYYFYIDHVAICVECEAKLSDDIEQNTPRVIWLRPDTPFGEKAMPAILATFRSDYFTLDDPRLDGFYFLEADRVDVIVRLDDAGYDTAD